MLSYGLIDRSEGCSSDPWTLLNRLKNDNWYNLKIGGRGRIISHHDYIIGSTYIAGFPVCQYFSGHTALHLLLEQLFVMPVIPYVVEIRTIPPRSASMQPIHIDQLLMEICRRTDEQGPIRPCYERKIRYTVLLAYQVDEDEE
jgi:hypothetical protein